MQYTGISAFDDFINKFMVVILNPIITLLTLIGFAIFVWGVVEYIQGATSEEKRAKGQQHIIWGLVGMMIMFGAFAITHIITNIDTTLFPVQK